ncbi:MAG: class I mannose-6-phosphate isomerase [Bacteroidetes bacterium]|nr:class I mannose-6-phosphate isomerase [Bacteroidota bacterium]MBU1720598.1 class I mannose-6-phosphate isomerase [Bacteroidota bacterium]
MSELYPLKFKTIFLDKIWGGQRIRTVLGKDFGKLPNCGEAWEISGVEGNISVVANGFLKGNKLSELVEVYMGDLVGEKIYDKFGEEFPLLVKFIDAHENLSIQVHPDDATARVRHNAWGKTEMWVVLHAEENAELVMGFNRTISRKEFVQHLENKTLNEILNVERVKTGDVFFIPSGRVHAIGPGILLAEIQQTSDITYRIYDWDRLDNQGNSRELHTELALDVIDFQHHDNYKTSYQSTENTLVKLVDCPYFVTSLFEINKPMDRDYSLLDSFVIIICIQGSAKIIDNKRETEIRCGESVLIPATGLTFRIEPTGNAKLLEVFGK